MVEQSLTGAISGEPPQTTRWTPFGLLNLVLLVAAIVAIVVMVKLAF